jgi:hypothetical protein
MHGRQDVMKLSVSGASLVPGFIGDAFPYALQQLSLLIFLFATIISTPPDELF